MGWGEGGGGLQSLHYLHHSWKTWEYDCPPPTPLPPLSLDTSPRSYWSAFLISYRQFVRFSLISFCCPRWFLVHIGQFPPPSFILIGQVTIVLIGQVPVILIGQFLSFSLVNIHCTAHVILSGQLLYCIPHWSISFALIVQFYFLIDEFYSIQW